MMKKLFYIALFFSSGCLALAPLQDVDLSAVSGQSGITIDTQMEGGLSIGEFKYTDSGEDSIEEGGGGSLSLLDIKIKDASVSFDIDVSAAGELSMKLNNFATTDMSIGAIQFNYDSLIADINPLDISSERQLQNYYSSLGAVYIHDYTLPNTADITFKLTSDGGFALTSTLPYGSFFYLTYTDDEYDDDPFVYDTNNDGETILNDTKGKNYISSRIGFNEFKLNDIKLKGSGVGDDSHLEITLGGTEGAITFGDININGSVIGSAGFENIRIENVSYLHIKGH